MEIKVEYDGKKVLRTEIRDWSYSICRKSEKVIHKNAILSVPTSIRIFAQVESFEKCSLRSAR